MLQPPSTTDADANEQARVTALDLVRHFAMHCQKVLGSELLGAYLIGSLAHGGFSRRYSDIDIALITEAALELQALDGFRREAVALSADWGPKFSLFWTDRSFNHGRFPPLDRVDYLDNAIALMGHKHLRPERPGLTEIREYLRGEPFANWARQARGFVAADALEPHDRKAYLRTLLYPARFCYSWMTGLMGSNDCAVAFVRERAMARLNVDLIESALRCREAAADPDILFPARQTLLSQIDVCAKTGDFAP